VLANISQNKCKKFALPLDSLDGCMVFLSKRIDDLDGHIQGMRADMRMIAIAVGEHTLGLTGSSTSWACTAPSV
jgi:hypothetical protein